MLFPSKPLPPTNNPHPSKLTKNEVVMNDYSQLSVKFGPAQLLRGEKKRASLKNLAQSRRDSIAIICIWMQLTGPVLWCNQAVCNTHMLETLQKSKALRGVFVLWISLRCGILGIIFNLKIIQILSISLFSVKRCLVTCHFFLLRRMILAEVIYKLLAI